MRIPASDKALLLAESITALKNGLKEGDPQSRMIIFPIDDQDFSTRGRIKSSFLWRGFSNLFKIRKNPHTFAAPQINFCGWASWPLSLPRSCLINGRSATPREGGKRMPDFAFLYESGLLCFILFCLQVVFRLLNLVLCFEIYQQTLWYGS